MQVCGIRGICLSWLDVWNSKGISSGENPFWEEPGDTTQWDQCLRWVMDAAQGDGLEPVQLQATAGLGIPEWF